MILATGATGFVGSALCRSLTARGRSFRAVSRHGERQSLGMEEIGPTTDWRPHLARVDVVVHLAARVHVVDERAADPLAAFRRDNVEATLNLARQARASGAGRFVFLSSIKVNGETTDRRGPFTAADAPDPVGPYAQSKFEAETALQRFAQESGLEVVIIRPPLVYGSGVKANFRAMVTAVERGIPLPLGAIDNRRSLVAVGNLVDLILRCCDHPAAPGRTFLVSDGDDVSTPALLRALARALGRPSRLIPVPAHWLALAAAALGRRAAAARLLGSLQADILSTRALLDWTPPLTLDAALAEATREGW